MKKPEDMKRSRDWYIFPDAMKELSHYDIQPTENGITFLTDPDNDEEDRRRVIKLLYLVLDCFSGVGPKFRPIGGAGGNITTEECIEGLKYYDKISVEDFMKDIKDSREKFEKERLNSLLRIKNTES